MSLTFETVMIVDDDDIDQRSNLRTLRRAGVCENAMQFYYADEAFEWLCDHPDQKIDLMLLDLNLPRFDGFEFLYAAANQLPKDMLRHVIVLTSSTNPDEFARALEFDPVRAVFTKPLTAKNLEEFSKLSS